MSKNHPGGLKYRKLKPKAVVHYANEQNPDRCFIRLFKLYKSLCPKDNLKWMPSIYCRSTIQQINAGTLIGHYTLDITVARMCSLGGIGGYRTNHSLSATAATRLYQASVDEQLVMEKTGHRSVEGVRNYKHTSDHQLQHLSDILTGSHGAVTPTSTDLSIQPVTQDNTGNISIHNSSSKHLTMNFAQTPSFNIQGCMVILNCVPVLPCVYLHTHQSCFIMLTIKIVIPLAVIYCLLIS